MPSRVACYPLPGLAVCALEVTCSFYAVPLSRIFGTPVVASAAFLTLPEHAICSINPTFCPFPRPTVGFYFVSPWEYDPEKARTFPTDTPLHDIVGVILEDLQSRPEAWQ